MEPQNSFFDLDFDSIYPEINAERFGLCFFNKLWRRINKNNFSLLMSFYGSHRAGKSLSACAFADILDPNFADELEQRVCYTTSDLLHTFSDIKRRNLHGSAVIVDEAGSGALSSSRWMEETSKIVSAELQACGWLNLAIFFITQNFQFLNTTARRLSQACCEVSRTHDEYCVIKVLWLNNSPWQQGMPKRHFPIFCERYEDGVSGPVYKINRLLMHMPRKDIVTRYEKHSREWKEKLLEDSALEVDLIDFDKKKKQAGAMDLNSIVKDVMKRKDEFQTVSRKKGVSSFYNKDLIRHVYKTSERESRIIKALAEQQSKRRPSVEYTE